MSKRVLINIEIQGRVCVCAHMCKTERKKGFDYGCVCEIVAKREIVWEGCQLESAEKAVFLMIL